MHDEYYPALSLGTNFFYHHQEVSLKKLCLLKNTPTAGCQPQPVLSKYLFSGFYENPDSIPARTYKNKLGSKYYYDANIIDIPFHHSKNRTVFTLLGLCLFFLVYTGSHS